MNDPVGRGASAAALPTAPVVSVLTTRPAHPTPRTLVEAGRRNGIVVRCGPRLDPRSSLVFVWSYLRPPALAAVRAYCDHHGVGIANTEQVGKWDQLVRLCDADIPIPNSRRAERLEDARYAAALIGYPVIIKTNWGLRSQGVELVRDAAELDRAWTGRHRVVQSYLPEGARCTRLLVIGDRVVSGVTRVALDGVHATYDHGRRATLEAYPLTADRVALAIAACRAVGVEVGGVDIVETAAGPYVLEVNHARVEFSDRDLHGPDAVGALAAWLAGRAHAHENARCATDQAGDGAGTAAQAGAGAQPSAAADRARRLRIVTGQPRHPGVAAISATCAAHGFAVDVGATIDPTADAAWIWELSRAARRRVVAQAAALPIAVVGGNGRTAWANRARLFRAEISVPRSLAVRTVEGALRAAAEFDYPVTVRTRSVRQAADPQELRALWRPRRLAAAGIIEPAHYESAPRMRVWVAGDRAFLARRRTRGRWYTIPVRHAPCDIAIAACHVLRIDLGTVDIAHFNSDYTVLRAVPGGVWITGLSEAAARAALTGVAESLRKSLDDQTLDRWADHPAADGLAPDDNPAGVGAAGGLVPRRQAAALHRTGSLRLTVVVARDHDGPGTGQRIGNIQALYRELVLRGHRIVPLSRPTDRALLDNADVILQDPLHTFGRSGGDELDRFLHENVAARCHLLRHMRTVTVDKRATHELARQLGVPAPLLYRKDDVTAELLPVIAKPRRSSLGIGVRLIEAVEDLRKLSAARMVLQQYIDSGVARAVSLRAVTVVDRVVAAAIFHNEGSVCSNLAQGGRAIPLTGPGRHLHLTRAEQKLLESIGIDPGRPGVPTAVADMAAAIGRHHSTNGAQMIGQDFVVDERRQWYFLEANIGFGTAVFNSTDGEGFPSNGRGSAHAGRVLADAVELSFGRTGRGDR